MHERMQATFGKNNCYWIRELISISDPCSALTISKTNLCSCRCMNAKVIRWVTNPIQKRKVTGRTENSPKDTGAISLVVHSATCTKLAKGWIQNFYHFSCTIGTFVVLHFKYDIERLTLTYWVWIVYFSFQVSKIYVHVNAFAFCQTHLNTFVWECFPCFLSCTFKHLY